MIGLYLFVGLLLAGALLGSPAVWWLRGWWDHSNTDTRAIDAMARRDARRQRDLLDALHDGHATEATR